MGTRNEELDPVALMHTKGYTVDWRSADGSQHSMSKHIGGHTIHATVDARGVTLSHVPMWSLLSVSTGPFSANHPRFEDIFESKMLAAAIALSVVEWPR